METVKKNVMTATYLHLNFPVGSLCYIYVCSRTPSSPPSHTCLFSTQPFDFKLQTSWHTPKSLTLCHLRTGHSPTYLQPYYYTQHISQTGTTILPNILPIFRFPSTSQRASWAPVEDIALLVAVVSLKSLDLEKPPFLVFSKLVL